MIMKETAETMIESGTYTLTNKTLSTGSDIDEDVDVTEVLKKVYPVGSIYFNASSTTNPATLMGFGTWVAWGGGRVPVGYNAGDSDFNSLEETGGAKTHTLTTSEMPYHTHTQNSHNHGIRYHAGGGSGYATVEDGGPWSPQTYHTSFIGSTTATNQYTGSSSAHNNLQPYITVYMWKRTA